MTDVSGKGRRGVYVTGTDTGCGKTVATLAIMAALKRRGARVGGMKPVASGCDVVEGRLVNDDARRIRSACSRATDYETVNPWAFEEPIAPHIAAARRGLRAEAGPVLEAWERQSRLADVIVVEGIGGWRVPLAENWEQADLVRDLGIGVILVVGLRLGCINHARITAEALHRDGVMLQGWIANQVQADYDTVAETLDCLDGFIAAPRLGRIPCRGSAGAAAESGELELDFLL